MTQIAFINTTVTKAAVLRQLHAHAKADEFIKGTYWDNGKGCAVGCTIHSGEHAEYESRFGIPQMLARLEDRIFEGLPNGKSKEWPVRFMSAVRPGANLSCVGWQFLHWLLTDKEVNPGIDHPLVRDAIKQCADVLVPLTKGMLVDPDAAASAARSAASAARSAAWSAESAESAAWSAASASWSAARSAESAESAAWSAASAASASRSAASAAYVLMANKLIELIEAAPTCRGRLMTAIRKFLSEVFIEAAIAVSLGAGFELISLFLFGLFVVGGARWVLA